MRRSGGRRLAFAAGWAVSLGLLIWVLSKIEWGAFFATLDSVRQGWVWLAGAIAVSGIVLRSLRWRRLAAIEGGRRRDFFRAASIGYLGNFIYPLRAGEFMRLIALKQLVPATTFGRILASSAIDRAFDLVAAGVFLAIVLRAHGADALGEDVVRAATGLVIFACAAILGFVFTARRWDPLVQGLARRLPDGAARRLRQFYGQALDAADAASVDRLAAALAFSMAACVADYAILWAMFMAFGWDLGPLAAVTVGVFVQVGVSLPSAPGFVGVIQAACVLSLALYHVSESAALAYSVLYQLTLFLVVTACGLSAAASAGLSLSARKATDAAGRRIEG